MSVLYIPVLPNGKKFHCIAKHLKSREVSNPNDDPRHEPKQGRVRTDSFNPARSGWSICLLRPVQSQDPQLIDR